MKQPVHKTYSLCNGLLFACRECALQEPHLLAPSFSDPHNGNQCAILFACEGTKYIYKPRPGAMDFAWAEFLERLQPMVDVPLPRAVLPVSSREAAYTIVPFAEGRETSCEEDVRRYYLRAGALLALCMVLGSTDLHAENLIADGDSPLLVDLETLISGVTPDKAAREPVFYDKLIRSHLLPNWMLVENQPVDVGALSARGKNMPKLKGHACPPWQYIHEISEGFRKTCEGLLQHREKALKLLQVFRGVNCRKLLRPTDLYARLYEQIKVLPPGGERERSAQRLRRAYDRAGKTWANQMAKVCDSEIAAVLRGDIPHFYSQADQTALRAMEGVVAENYFSLSPLESARQRLLALEERHVEEQLRIISQGFQSANPEIHTTPVKSAMDVFRLLESRSIDENPCSFVGLTTDDRSCAYFQSIGFSLYEGLLGVLVFYAALYEATGSREVRLSLEKRYKAYRQLYILPEAPIAASAATLNLTNGLAGHIIGLGYIGRCLQTDQYICDASRLFGRFRFQNSLTADADLYNGTAGLLMALPLLMGQGADASLAETATLLVKGVIDVQPALIGFAHGAAGAALAMGAAQYVTGHDVSASILRLLKWENAHYDEKTRNWPDLRDPASPGFMKGLCSGAPGIALARRQLLRYTNHPEITAICKEDLRRATCFLQEQQPLKRDTLCCGNASLAEAGRVLGIPLLRLNDRISLYHPLNTNDFSAGLFQGWAGVGYALARMLPGSKNSLFVWETQA